MKKLVSLFLALVLSLGLAVPALASFHNVFIIHADGETEGVNASSSGDGWTYDEETNTLTLNGAKDLNFAISTIGHDPTVVLAPGSKNTLRGLSAEGDDSGTTVFTIKGSGELTLYDPDPDEFARSHGVFYGLDVQIKFEDGLTMSGGTTEGSSGALTIKNEGINNRCMAGSNLAMYVRIAPAGGSAPAASSAGFTDVAANSPFAEAIKWAVDKKITTGITATTFGPGNPCTIGHANTFLWRNAGRPAPSDASASSDMDKAEMWALNDAGYMDRLDERSDVCTRVWIVRSLWDLAGKPQPSKTAGFTDIEGLDADQKTAISWAVEKGITSGKTAASFAPNDPCTRGQIVTFLYRAAQ